MMSKVSHKQPIEYATPRRPAMSAVKKWLLITMSAVVGVLVVWAALFYAHWISLDIDWH